MNGTIHATDSVAAQAQIDLTTAYGVAASLTPTASGLGDLTGQPLTPGVYSGGALSLTGALTLAGTAESVWVFQAASTLTINAGSIITVTGGASACNVFWQVGSSATIEPGAQFVGAVMADASITAQTGATVVGRLLARTGAVTLDTNTITAPTGCAAAGNVSTSPTITSDAPPAGAVGTGYSHTITASGTPTATFTTSSGALPLGVTLDSATGAIAGEPTTAGTYTFEITASNGTAPDAVVTDEITIAAAADTSTDSVTPGAAEGGAGSPTAGANAFATPALAESGAESPTATFAVLLIAVGLGFVFYARRRARLAALVHPYSDPPNQLLVKMSESAGGGGPHDLGDDERPAASHAPRQCGEARMRPRAVRAVSLAPGQRTLAVNARVVADPGQFFAASANHQEAQLLGAVG